ncbi:hypothetical protein AX774_g2075 [Zancudomyces culisetae]|uniref:Uncharacterized protein n=1 Tax=Zancudomyces culisetae TaxID=1213189 RepID=A0A1R1PTX4_ZANCU|nr:hypothetical protein AX774_g2075 [Zancudomyces culisetae]|eukprot:OMH84401.1 hypothetical protein AX774_g2075 [Zancudomyces culisetae]
MELLSEGRTQPYDVVLGNLVETPMGLSRMGHTFRGTGQEKHKVVGTDVKRTLERPSEIPAWATDGSEGNVQAAINRMDRLFGKSERLAAGRFADDHCYPKNTICSVINDPTWRRGSIDSGARFFSDKREVRGDIRRIKGVESKKKSLTIENSNQFKRSLYQSTVNDTVKTKLKSPKSHQKTELRQSSRVESFPLSVERLAQESVDIYQKNKKVEEMEEKIKSTRAQLVSQLALIDNLEGMNKNLCFEINGKMDTINELLKKNYLLSLKEQKITNKLINCQAENEALKKENILLKAKLSNMLISNKQKTVKTNDADGGANKMGYNELCEIASQFKTLKKYILRLSNTLLLVDKENKNFIENNRLIVPSHLDICSCNQKNLITLGSGRAQKGISSYNIDSTGLKVKSYFVDLYELINNTNLAIKRFIDSGDGLENYVSLSSPFPSPIDKNPTPFPINTTKVHNNEFSVTRNSDTTISPKPDCPSCENFKTTIESLLLDNDFYRENIDNLQTRLIGCVDDHNLLVDKFIAHKKDILESFNIASSPLRS